MCLLTLHILFEEMSAQILCLVFNWDVYLFVVREFLLILDSTFLWDTWFTNIFSHSVNCLIIFLIVSFEAQTLLILMKSNSLTFHAFTFGIIIKRPLPNLRSQKFNLCFFLNFCSFRLHFSIWFIWVNFCICVR